MVGKISLFLLAFALAATCCGQWTVVNLHPSGAAVSQAIRVRDGIQAGWATTVDGNKASRWTGTAGSWEALAPAGQNFSYANGIAGGQVSGMFNPHAVIFAAPGSIVDLHPASATSSYVFGSDGGMQGGYARIASVTQAGIWSGSAASWQSLHTAGATESQINDVRGGQQVGYATFFGTRQASLWTGTAASRASLHPAGSTESNAYGVDNGVQVGYATSLGVQRASIWRGNIGSWLSIHPVGATHSIAWSIDGDFQSGWARFSGNNKAGIWSGTTQSWVNLASFLPPEFSTFSEAYSVWRDGNTLYVAGAGVNSTAGAYQALLWISRLVISTFSPIRGIVTAGNQQSLEASDDDRVLVRPGIVFSTQQAPVEIRFDGVANSANPSGLSFSVESSASFGNAQQVMLLWNYQTGAYETLDTRTVTLEDDVYRVSVTSNAARFVEPGTLAVRAAVTVRAAGPSFAYPWTYRLDRAWWNFPG